MSMGIKSMTLLKPNLENVSETLLVPLFFRAKETLEKGIIKDEAAVDIVRQLDYDFERMVSDKSTQAVISIRTKVLDQVVEEYIRETECPVIINLGSGLDTRHIRFSDVKWYQLDLDQSLHLRSFFFKEENGIAKSILDFSWINDVKEKNDVLIIIEGVLMYLDEEQVKSLFQAICSHFINSRVVFDTIPESFVQLKKHKSINLRTAPFKWGNSNVSQIEQWNSGLRKVKDYPYFRSSFRRWPLYTLLLLYPIFRKGLKISLLKIN
jgi:O-methyltransferase involved in polyketide biosynthesis